MAGILQTLLGSLAGVIKDAYFKYVTLLLPGNGTNGAQNNTFLDGSTNNFTITRNGNTTQGTFTPYGANWSNYFDGTGDYLTVPQNAALAFGTGDFTVEFWVNVSTYRTTPGGFYDCFLALGNFADSPYFRITPSGVAETGLATNALTGTTVFQRNTWYHYAVTRSGTTARLFINGALEATVTNSSNLLNGTAAYIGTSQWNTASETMTGFFSNLRIVKGAAVYTAAFTPPTSPLTAITNTSLLTCQSNRLIDNSTNAFTITKNGDVSVQRFSPFSPSDPYSTSVVGGSGYFDGTGDYLTAPNNAAFNLGSNSFTTELWVYPTALAGASGAGIISRRANTTQYFSFILIFGASSLTPYLYVTFDGSTWGIASGSSIACVLNQWNHLALVRNGSTWTIYVNGVAGYSTTASGAIYDGTAAQTIGASAADGSFPFAGYISNVRIVNGTAVYTANFTPPTVPLTAITNTSLLLLGTNAGIIDNAMMNDLETVGNAQISTTQSKFGGSSMYFDGTGDWLLGTTSNVNFQFGTGDFTVEMWVYTSNLAAYQTLIDTRAADTASAWGLFINNTGKPYWYDASDAQTSSTALTSNTWQHLAVARSGSTIKIFLDGTQVFSGTNSNSQNSTGPFVVGRNIASTVTYTGYIDDLRITKGVARYTANFTPPVVALPLQ